jgi:hypothetical protein
VLWRATFVARSAVEEDDPWELFIILRLVGVGFVFASTAGEDLDGACFWFGVILGDVEEVFGDS